MGGDVGTLQIHGQYVQLDATIHLHHTGLPTVSPSPPLSSSNSVVEKSGEHCCPTPLCTPD